MKKELVITKPQRAFFLGALFSKSPLKALNGNVIDFSLFDSHEFNARAMELAFNCLLERNDSLRIHLIRKGILFYQCFEDYHWVNTEKTHVKDKQEFENMAKAMYEEISFMANPLYRVKIVECEDGTGGICMCFHHLIIDGYSIELICKHLNHYYKCFCMNEIPEKEKTYSVTKYSEFEKKYLLSPKYKEDRKFWFNQYNHQPRYSFPAGKVPTAGDDDKILFTLANHEYAILFDLCKKFSCSFTSMIMSISALTVFRLTGEHNFCFFALSHGRRNYVLKQTIGNLYNNYPVFYDIKEDVTFEECLIDNHQRYLEHMAHSQFPIANMTLMTAKETCFKHIGYGHQWCMFSTMDFMEIASKIDLDYLSSNRTMIFSLFYVGLFHMPEKQRIDIDISYQKKCFNTNQMQKIFDAFRETIRTASANLENEISMQMKS